MLKSDALTKAQWEQGRFRPVVGAAGAGLQRHGAGAAAVPSGQLHQALARLGDHRRKFDPAVQPGVGEFSWPPPASATELRLGSRQPGGDFHMLPPKSAPR